MALKQIPFDLETAKKIQAGDIKGFIIDKNGYIGEIVSFNSSNTPLPIVVKFSFKDGDNIFFVGNDGVSTKIELLLKVPDNEHKFKQHDKVLVRDRDNERWIFSFFRGIHKNPHFPYVCINTYAQCIPYIGNEHLLNTTDKPKED